MSDFVNPYNFVRVEAPDPKAPDRSAPTATHDVFNSRLFSGKIRCRLTAVSPLFVPDPGSKTPLAGRGRLTHYGYDFFCLHGRPSLPATSLKGMLRSVYETISTSCFSQLGRRDEKINFRGPAESDGLEPGIVLRLPTSHSAGVILRCDEAMWVAKYLNGDEYPYNDDGSVVKGLQNLNSAVVNGQRISFVCHKLPYSKRRGRRTNRFEFWLALPAGNKITDANCGYLKITGKKPGSNKKFERIFYSQVFTHFKDRLPSKSSGLADLIPELREIDPKVLAKEGKPLLFEFSVDEKNRFDSICRQQVKSQLATEYDGTSNYSKGTVYYGTSLSVGDLVYFRAPRQPEAKAEHIAYVNLAKSTFGRNAFDLLEAYSTHLLPCRKVAKLCPACRLFGAADIALEDGSPTSLAGRIRISDIVCSNPSSTIRAPLKVLNSPHETATSFYLIDPGYRNARTIVKQVGKGYDTSPVPLLRGRKYYWHQCDDAHALDDRAYRSPGGQTDQMNATATLLREGAQFEFDLHFENLDPTELAYLMWSIELEKGMLHKLGHGKPLGLGSVKLEIVCDESYFIDAAKRYRDIRSNGRVGFDKVSLSLAAATNGGSPGLGLHIDQDGKPAETVTIDLPVRTYMDLKAIMTPQPKLFDLVDYPQLNGKGYAWFGKYKAQPLCTIQETLTGSRQTGWG